MMRALHLDFVSDLRLQRRLGVALLLMSLATLAWLAQAYLAANAELSSWEARWHELQIAQHKPIGPVHSSKADLEKLQIELKAANRVIARLSMPWDRLFREVEGSIDEQVTLLGMEPDTEKRELRITAEAKSLAAMLEYVQGLHNIALFRDAHVLSHQIQQQDPQRPVRFQANVRWLELSQLPTFQPLPLQPVPPFEGAP